MINFFRKIRKNLADDNKPLKYMRYAVGEIVLVVIGILFALQINNWNEERKERLLETKILKEIVSNLNIDLIGIRDDIAIMDSVNLACHDIILFMETDSTPSESIYYNAPKIRENLHFDPNKSGYSLLISKGVEIILNDSLGGAISNLYESSYPYYRRYEEERTMFKAKQIDPKLIDYFTWLPNPELYFFAFFQISKEDYIKMKSDANFLKLVHAIKHENSIVQNRAQRTEGKIIEIMGQLKKELLKLKD